MGWWGWAPTESWWEKSLCCLPTGSYSWASSEGGRSISWKADCESAPLSRAAGPQLGTLADLSQLPSELEHKANFATAKNLCFWNKNHLFSEDSLIPMNCGLFLLLADIPWKGTYVIRCQRRAAWSNFRGTHHCIFTANKENECNYASHCSDPTSFQGGDCALKKGVLFPLLSELEQLPQPLLNLAK